MELKCKKHQIMAKKQVNCARDLITSDRVSKSDFAKKSTQIWLQSFGPIQYSCKSVSTVFAQEQCDIFIYH